MTTRTFTPHSWLLALVMLLASPLFAQYYNTSTDLLDRDEVRNLQILSPGIVPVLGPGHVTTGFSEDLSSPLGPITFANLVQYDPTGAVVWSKIYDFGTGLSRGNAVEITPGGGFVIAGHGINPVSGVPSAWVMETDAFGTPIWSQFYDFFSPYSEAFSIEPVDPAIFGFAFVATGSYRNPFSGTMDMFAMALDPIGGVVAMGQYDTGMEEEGLSIKVDGTVGAVPRILVSGYTTFGTAPGRNVLVCELDPTMTMIWGTIFGGPADEEGRSLEILPSGEALVAGYSNSFSNGGMDVYMSLVAPGGPLVWSNIYGQKKDEQGHSVELISDGTIAVTGWTNRTPTASEDAFLFKTDLGGLLLWSRIFGGARNDVGYSVKENRSTAGIIGELLMGGVFNAVPGAAVDDRDLYNVYVDPAGNGACGKDPNFKQLNVLPIQDPLLLPPGSLYYSNPVLPVDPPVPFTQKDECCSCADMLALFAYSPAGFCAGTPVTFTNLSSCIDQFRWSVNGTVVGYSTDLTYIFSTPGTYTVTLDGKNAGCPIVSYSVTITVTCLDIDPASKVIEEELHLMPNPANTNVTVQAQLAGSEETGTLRIHDAIGRTVISRNVALVNGSLRETIDVAELPNGFYTVEVLSGAVRWNDRLVISHE